jgi:hypothetical protein
LLAQKRNKKRQSAMKQPIADEGISISFCTTVVKGGGVMMIPIKRHCVEVLNSLAEFYL